MYKFLGVEVKDKKTGEDTLIRFGDQVTVKDIYTILEEEEVEPTGRFAIISAKSKKKIPTEMRRAFEED